MQLAPPSATDTWNLSGSPGGGAEVEEEWLIGTEAESADGSVRWDELLRHARDRTRQKKLKHPGIGHTLRLRGQNIWVAP